MGAAPEGDVHEWGQTPIVHRSKPVPVPKLMGCTIGV